MGGIVVLFQPEGLPVERAIELGELAPSLRHFCLVVVPTARGHLGEVVAEELEPAGPEEATGKEVEQLDEDDLLFDAEHARVSRCLCRGDAVAVGVLAAVPVGALLVAARHPSPAEGAADASAERVEACAAPAGSLDVLLRFRELGLLFVACCVFLDEVEQLLRNQRVVRRLGAPDPLLAWPNERPAASLVVAAPDVEAGVLRVAEHGLDLGAAPGRPEVVLVLLVSGRRRVAVEIAVELLADRAEAEAVDAVVLEDHPDDRRLNRVWDEPMLALALARLMRVGVA